MRLKGIAERAPYANGPTPLVDENVRDGWQMNACKFRASCPEAFAKCVSKLAIESCAQLRLDLEPVGVDVLPSQVLLYERDGHFVRHSCASKVPGKMEKDIYTYTK